MGTFDERLAVAIRAKMSFRRYPSLRKEQAAAAGEAIAKGAKALMRLIRGSGTNNQKT